MRTPRNILRHELIGLNCEIRKSSDKNHTGLKGKIVDETMQTICLMTEKGSRRVPKKGSVFRIELDDKKVDVEGDHLFSRPEDRIKKKFRKW